MNWTPKLARLAGSTKLLSPIRHSMKVQADRAASKPGTLVERTQLITHVRCLKLSASSCPPAPRRVFKRVLEHLPESDLP